MFSPSRFRDLVSGRRSGLGAALLRSVLRLAEAPYCLAVRVRNYCYDVGLAKTHRVPVPVISVGNLSLGGTGKSPMVEWLVRWFRECGVPVAVISRGYGAQTGGPAGGNNDEALELRQKLPEVPHFQSPDRLGAAQRALQQTGCRLIVLDDAFQHRRIGRDLDLVMLDALEPFGFGHVFPRGTLREPISGLRRAQVVVLARADMAEPALRDEIRRKVALYAPYAVWAEAAHAPRVLRSAGGSEQPIQSLAGQPVIGFCGVGNPAGFRHTLDVCGYRVVDFREFADHYQYTRADMESLAAWADRTDAAAVLCTQKDLVKLEVDRLGGRPLWAVTVGLEFLAGRDALEATLHGLLRDR